MTRMKMEVVLMKMEVVMMEMEVVMMKVLNIKLVYERDLRNTKLVNCTIVVFFLSE